jgi:hypothetical protein
MRKLILVATLAAACVAFAQPVEHHKMVMVGDLKWDDVPSLPPGAKIAVIEGPMSQAVPFTVRLSFPANYRIPRTGTRPSKESPSCRASSLWASARSSRRRNPPASSPAE